MVFIDKIKEFIEGLEEREFYIYLSAFFLAFVLFMSLLIYWHKSRMNYWQTQLSELKKQKTITRRLLDENATVELDRKKVNDILTSGSTSFKIFDFYVNMVNQLDLANYKTKEPAEPQTIQLESGEKERTLAVDFHDLNMKQVTDILKYIEDNPRVYAKRLNIEKSKDKPSVNISIEIATIEPQLQQD